MKINKINQMEQLDIGNSSVIVKHHINIDEHDRLDMTK